MFQKVVDRSEAPQAQTAHELVNLFRAYSETCRISSIEWRSGMKAMATNYRIISADSHVNPPPTFWREYLPERFKDAAPRLEDTDEGDFVVFEGQRSPF